MKALAFALLMESTVTETLENLDATATGEVAQFLFKQRRNEEDFSGIHLAHHKTLKPSSRRAWLRKPRHRGDTEPCHPCPEALVHAWKAEDTFWEPFSPTLRTVGIKLKSLELTAGTLALGPSHQPLLPRFEDQTCLVGSCQPPDSCFCTTAFQDVRALLRVHYLPLVWKFENTLLP